MERRLDSEIEKVLSLARARSQEAEVFVASFDQMPVVFEANRLKQLHTRQGLSIALRIVREGRIGFSTGTTVGDAASLVDRAVETSCFGALAKFEFPGSQSYPGVEIYDDRVESLPIERMIDMGESLISAVGAHTPELLCDARVVKSTVSVHVVNSRGAEAKFRRSSFGISLDGNLVQGTDMLFVGDGESSCHPIEDTGGVVRSVVGQLDMAKRQASVLGGSLPVIFTPDGVVSAFVAPLATALDGKMVLQGASALSTRKGERVFDEKLSLTDDATVGYRPSSRPCDDEGVPSRATPLVTDGVVAGFVYDLQTAALAGVGSTGSADRGGGGALPRPAISALVFGTGDVPFDDMVRGLGTGLVVEQLMGASFTNVLGGGFSGNVLLGYKVEDGEVVGRVKDTVVSGNIFEALRKVIGIGREGKWVGSVFTPAICCSDLTIGSKA